MSSSVESASEAKDSVETIRARFEKELAAKEGVYHPIDIERVRTEEWQVTRFLVEHQGNEDKAFEAMCTALQWKNEFGVHDRTDQYFPKEIWELNGVEINGRDHQGRIVQWEAYRNQRVFKETMLLAKRFIAHNIERVDRLAGPSGFIVVMDTNGAGLSNIDLDLIKFKLSITEHYPGGIKQLLIVDLPWLLNSVMSIIMSFMSPKLRELVIYTKRADLAKYIEEDAIPVALGGKREKPCFPPDLIPFDQLIAEFGITEKFIDYFYKLFKLARTTSGVIEAAK